MDEYRTCITFVVLLAISQTVKSSGNGWTNAHATFYGGSDASGTMGKFIDISSSSYRINGGCNL